MNDLSDKTVLVTGATDGLGRGMARALAQRGAAILLHGRDEQRAEALASELRANHGANVRVYLADFSSLLEVRTMAESVLQNEARLDVLVNNAGIGASVPTRERAESRDGIELRFAVNYLSHYLLTRDLLPLLKRAAPARIVNVSSAGQAPIDFEDPMLESGYSGVRAYCQSKLAQILSTIELAGEVASAGITVNALHPSTFMPTKIVSKPTSTLEQGVAATMHLIADPALARVTGKYFDRTQEAQSHLQAYDAAARAQLHALSEQLLARVLI